MKKLYSAYFKKVVLLTTDLCFVLLSLPVALYIRFEPWSLSGIWFIVTSHHYALVFLSYLFAFFFLRTYRTIVRLANLSTALRVLASVLLGGTISYILANHIVSIPLLPRSVYIIQMLLVAPACLFSRFSIRIVNRISLPSREGIPTLVYGAGLTTDRFLPFVLQHQKEQIRVVGLIDDDRAKHRSEVQGIRVRGGRSDIPRLVARYKVEQVILSMPTLTGAKLREVVDFLYEQNLKVKILPTVESYVNAVNTKELDIRDLNIEDLLRRPSRHIDKNAISRILNGKTVLVTGGGGSIGSELVRQIASMGPSTLIVNDASEFALYNITEEIRAKYPSLNFVAHLGNVADRKICENLFAAQPINAVFHACAYKHVPLVEENVCAAIRNNVLSARNVFELASGSGAERVVLISSDKAVRPTNVMGATKRICELLALWYAAMQTGQTQCAFSAVRFGNVLGSSGSVVPKFVEQIRAGGPVTITHPNITRFFMLIPEAVSLVLQAATASASGEIFVLDMGEPIRIVDMARDLIRLMGKRPDVDVKIAFTGLRPGEKLYEELQLETENIQSVTEDFFKLVRVAEPQANFMEQIESMLSSALIGDHLAAKECLFSVVRRYESDIQPVDAAAATTSSAQVLPISGALGR